MNPEDARSRIQNRSGKTFLGSRKSTLGVERDIGISDEKRLTHVLNLGPTGYGKTQLLAQTALQDGYKGHGLCIVNPKGDLIDEFIAKLPEERWEDIIYINPGQEEVASVNVLEPYTEGMTPVQKENQKEIIVSDLIDLFKRRSENWGDQFGRILEILLRAHIDLNIRNNECNTLVDVYRCVINPDELDDLIDRTDDLVVREQLVRIREDITSYEMGPLRRRLNDFMMNSVIRRFIDGKGSVIDFREAVNQGKIILVDIRKGEVGGTVSEIVGSIVITEVWSAVQSRVTQPVEERQPFYLFIDELQNFVGEESNFVKILSESREYRLGCWLSTQYLEHLPVKMRRSVTNNCRTKICFNPSGSEDEHRIAGMLQGVEKQQLKSLGKYRAAVQKPSERSYSSATFFSTYPPWNVDRDHVDQIKKRQTPRTDTDTDIGLSPSLGQGTNAGGEKHAELLEKAKERLEERGLQVNLLYQGEGESKPDGHVHLPNGTAHLEAEHTTLTKPAKVLQNFRRAVNDDVECIFVVEQGNAAKLRSIVEDPVNRNGDEHEDEHGSYSYYTTDGDEFTDTEPVLDGEYRIIEVGEDSLTVHEPGESEDEESSIDELREKDRVVLNRIQNGEDDVQKLTEATSLENHEVNYCFRKLEKLDLITVEKPEGTVERVIDGQKRVFEAPKQATLTNRGKQQFQ